MKRLLFVYNPHAGRERVKTELSDIISVFSEAGYEVLVRPTLLPGEMSELARNCPADADIFVCSGGDGTLNEAVNGILRREAGTLPIGYIPAGSTNDFSVSLGIPTDIRKAAETAVGGRKFSCDIGSFNGDNFCYVAAFGVFTDVAYDTEQSLKNTLGYGAYLVEAMRRLPNLRSYEARFEWEAGFVSGNFLLGLICNSDSVGGIRGITGGAVKLDDGKFEVLLVKAPGPGTDLAEIASVLMSGDIIANSPNIISFKASHLKVTATGIEPIPWTVDGEYGGMPREADIRILPRAVEFLVP